MALPTGNDNDVSGKDLLQANATVIAGILVLLTISSSVAPQYSSAINRQALVWASTIIIIPMAYSSAIILSARYSSVGTLPDLRKAKQYTWTGFLFILATFIGLAILTLFSLPTLVSQPIAVQCAKDPKKFNITDQSKCSDFSVDSLAEQCAKNPSSFNLKLSQCSRFIPNVPSRV